MSDFDDWLSREPETCFGIPEQADSGHDCDSGSECQACGVPEAEAVCLNHRSARLCVDCKREAVLMSLDAILSQFPDAEQAEAS